MHFVAGGAYNGKAKWVRSQYPDYQWISAYKGNAIPENFMENIVVLEGIEAWIEEDIHSLEADAIRAKWQEIIQSWEIWEQEKAERSLVMIGSDITKGIVPIEAHHRKWRDASGWVFQDIVAKASRVDIIWYGLPQRIK